MALSSLLLPATQRRLVAQVPDSTLAPYGGQWGARVNDAPRNHDDLTEFDYNVATAANLVARDATNVAAIRQPTQVVLNRAFQFVRHEEFSQSDMTTILNAEQAPGVPAFRQRVLDVSAKATARNLGGLKITRGYLIAAAAIGEINWSLWGYQASATAFLMPSQLKLTPTTYWRNTSDVANTAATPISDMAAADQAAILLNGTPYTDVDIDYAGALAMLATTQYQNQALRYIAALQTASLPVPGTGDSFNLLSQVIGKKVHVVQNTFRRDAADGSQSTLTYVPAGYAVLWRSASIGTDMEFANVPVTKAAIAALLGSNAFNGDAGDLRGPVTWGGGDTREFTNAGLYAAQEGVPVRVDRTATAVIYTRG